MLCLNAVHLFVNFYVKSHQPTFTLPASHGPYDSLGQAIAEFLLQCGMHKYAATLYCNGKHESRCRLKLSSKTSYETFFSVIKIEIRSYVNRKEEGKCEYFQMLHLR